MTSITSLAAKKQLPELMGRVAKGERIMITHRGKPAAMLVPPDEIESEAIATVIDQMRELRKGNVLGEDLSIRELLEQGRR